MSQPSTSTPTLERTRNGNDRDRSAHPLTAVQPAGVEHPLAQLRQLLGDDALNREIARERAAVGDEHRLRGSRRRSRSARPTPPGPARRASGWARARWPPAAVRSRGDRPRRTNRMQLDGEKLVLREAYFDLLPLPIALLTRPRAWPRALCNMRAHPLPRLRPSRTPRAPRTHEHPAEK